MTREKHQGFSFADYCFTLCVKLFVSCTRNYSPLGNLEKRKEMIGQERFGYWICKEKKSCYPLLSGKSSGKE